MDALKTKIEITGLRVQTCIGCPPEEQAQRRELVMDIAVYFNPADIQSDRLSDTVDYMMIQNLIGEICEKSKTALLEKLAWSISEKIYKQVSLAQEIHLKIKKFYAMPQAQNVAFELITKR